MNQETEKYLDDLDEDIDNSINQTEFVTEVLKIASQYNPDLVNSTSYEDVLKELQAMKDKAMRWEIIVSSFKPEPELFPIADT